MEPKIRLQMIGQLQIEVNGRPAEFKRRKSEALVAYLALHEGSILRERIATAFWGNSSDENARRTLRVILTDIRKTLGEDAVIGNRDTLALNEDTFQDIDARKFTALLSNPVTASTPDLLASLELYRGDLLDGVNEDWVLPLRESFRASVLAALTTLADRARTDGQYAQSAGYAERMLHIDPFNETGLQHLLFSLAAQGERDRALSRFNEFEKQGVEPSKETLALVEQIRKQAVSGAARSNNLPRPLTSFIGREDELNEVETLLTKHRLVTLLGAGGSGKTRLSIQAADEVTHEYAQVWWVDLSPLHEPALVPQTIAKALGVREQVGKPHIRSIAEYIGEQKILIVLDNCEQVLSACSQSVNALLSECSQLGVLATSREPLGVDGEVEWLVPVFPLPDTGMNAKSLNRNEAVRLFLERGRSTNPSFELTEGNASYVVEICRRLDGIPLALELAATLLRSMPVEDVSKRIEKQFEALHLNDDARPLRQQTLHALIDWSYKLLTPAEQIFFRRLGVFAGGWYFESAMAVAGGYESDDLHAGQVGKDQLKPLPISVKDIVYNLMESLKRRSLISVTHTGGITRYRMLETLREFALERCKENNELEVLNSRHIKALLRFAVEIDNQLSWGTANQADLLQQFDPELDNVRAAFKWALQGFDMENGMMLGASVQRYYSARQMYSEIRDWLGRLFDHPNAQTPTKARAHLLVQYALCLRNDPQKRFTPAITREAVNIFSSFNDAEGIALANFAEGETLHNYNEFEFTEQPLLDSLAYFRVNSKNIQVATAVLTALARIETTRRNFKKAYDYLHESLKIAENSQADMAKGWNLLTLGDVAFQMNDLELAAQHYKRSLEYYLPLKRFANSAYLQEALAAVYFAQKDFENAQTWAEASIASYDAYGGEGTMGRVYKAAAAQALGDLDTARHWLLRALESGMPLEQFSAQFTLRLADYAFARNLMPEALTLYAYTLRLMQDARVIFFPPEQKEAEEGVGKLRIVVPQGEYQTLMDRVASITFDAAVGLVFPPQ